MMGKKLDLVGRQFGRLFVISENGRSSSGATVWLCQCACGEKLSVRNDSLTTGNTTSCGCYNKEKSSVDLLNKRFGKLLVIEKLHKRLDNGGVSWKCSCDCGGETIVGTSNIVSGRTTSCGCYNKELITKHGFSHTSEYKIWKGMLYRCYDENNVSFKNYGGRSINVCEKWRNSFDEFYKDMGKRPSPEHTIDRINNDGDYEPTNCRWATIETQANNRSNNVYYEHNGEKLTISQISKREGINYQTLRTRLDKYNNIENALKRPVRFKRSILGIC